MTMSKTIAAERFKAQCLALLDRVARTGESFVITKHGKPIAKLVPVARERKQRSLKGSVKIHGDIVAPLFADWEPDL